MMTHARNLTRDLVERRLWPVALLLAVALAAVPVVLGRGGSDAATPVALPTAPATGAASDNSRKAQVTLDTSVPAPGATDGHARNPFQAPSGPKKASTPTSSDSSALPAPTPAASTATDTSSGSSAATSGSTGPDTTTSTPTTGSGSTSGSGSTKATTPTTKPKTTATAPKAEDASDTYHVSVRFGVNGGATKTIRDIARLSPLPSVTDPFFVYLGVMETATTHEKRAVFLVSSDATPNGEGSCHPTKNDCESVELAVGQTAFFDIPAPSGGPGTQYQLELAGIHKTAVVSTAKASAAFARHSVAGAELLGDAAKRNVRAAAGARAYRYVPQTGLLVRAKRKHVTAKAAAAGTLIPGIALLSRKHQPGIPVWHSPNN
jgi:hypothetical protein